MNREENVKSFEELMGRVNREGKDALMDYIRKSDFYTAPVKGIGAKRLYAIRDSIEATFKGAGEDKKEE